jgi:hypothetical protein
MEVDFIQDSKMNEILATCRMPEVVRYYNGFL